MMRSVKLMNTPMTYCEKTPSLIGLVCINQHHFQCDLTLFLIGFLHALHTRSALQRLFTFHI